MIHVRVHLILFLYDILHEFDLTRLKKEKKKMNYFVPTRFSILYEFILYFILLYYFPFF